MRPPLRSLSLAYSGRALILIGSMLMLCSPAQAQSGEAVQAGERVSDWLLRVAGPTPVPGVAHWMPERERAPQANLKARTVQALEGHARQRTQAPNTAQTAADWLAAQPVTARVPLQSSLARALQVRPTEDPVLAAGDQMRWYPGLSQVAVLGLQGTPCVLAHTPGAHAADYVTACRRLSESTTARSSEPAGGRPRVETSRVSRVWIVQPEGRVHTAGIAPWSLTEQPQPAPGAWIWAPADQAGLPESLSKDVAQILASLPPAGAEPMPRATVPASASSPSSSVGSLAGSLASPSPSPAASLSVRPSAAPRDLSLTASDWGEIGLLQTPTARMAPAGAARFNLSQTKPYTHGNVMFQPLDWLEFGFRYTDISNRIHGPGIAWGQSYKDKSIDLKLRLFEESAYVPQVAVGIRDLGGTGLFSGEYLVASKRWGAWDFSLGLGWGYLGARGNLSNPLSVLGSRWDTRPGSLVGEGGIPAVQTFFRGPTSLFGGVQYQVNSQWLIKAEVDGNDYRREPQGNTQRQSSPVNFGVVYRPTSWLDWSAGLERGNTLMLGLTVHTGPQGLQGLATPKVLAPPLPPIQAMAPQAAPAPQASTAPVQLDPARLKALQSAVQARTGWTLKRLTLQGDRARATMETDAGVHAKQRLHDLIRLLHAALPAQVRRIELSLQQRGMALTRVSIDREQWVAERTTRVPPSLQDQAVRLGPGDGAGLPSSIDLQTPAFSVGVGPSYQQILGGPDGFLLFKLGAQVDAQWRLAPGTWIAGSADLRVIDNYDRFKYTAPSELPRVRTYAREYATASRFTIPMLQAQQVWALGQGHHLSVYGGLLEPMFGGVGAEWLWRPWNGRVALGLDVNQVWQRDFEQDFGFRDYRVTTGHVSVYWDTGWHDLQAKLMVGQYLAGDVGATLDVRRQFANGVSIGAWATKTNVSSAQFGEGSFDKGIYLRVPFDVLLARATPGMANIVWNPLTRDGGARLQRRFTLDELTRQGSQGAWSIVPADSAR